MKTGYTFLLSLLLLGNLSLQSQDFSLLDQIKNSCVGVLPQEYQENARPWFWPAVTVTAVLGCAGIYCWLKSRAPVDPGQAFYDLANKLLSADPLVSDQKSRDPYTVALHVLGDGSGATLRFRIREGAVERQLAAYIIDLHAYDSNLTQDLVSQVLKKLP